MNKLLRQVLFIGVKTLDEQIQSLFSSGEQGVIFRPYDFSTLYKDYLGTIPVTAVGDPVGKMLDCSGRGNHVIQQTDANRPILRQDGNGKYYLEGNGTNRRLYGAATFNAASRKAVLAVAAQKNTSAIAGVISTNLFTSPGITLQTTTYAGAGGASNGYQIYLGGSPSAGDALSTYNHPIKNTHFCKFDRTGGTILTQIISPEVDGATPTRTQSGSPVPNADFGTQSLVVMGYGAGYWLNGNFYGAVLRYADNTAAQDTLMKQWLTTL